MEGPDTPVQRCWLAFTNHFLFLYEQNRNRAFSVEMSNVKCFFSYFVFVLLVKKRKPHFNFSLYSALKSIPWWNYLQYHVSSVTCWMVLISCPQCQAFLVIQFANLNPCLSPPTCLQPLTQNTVAFTFKQCLFATLTWLHKSITLALLVEAKVSGGEDLPPWPAQVIESIHPL